MPIQCTTAKLRAAEAAYNHSAMEFGHPTAMLTPLRAALDAALAFLPESVGAGTLDRSDALVRAQEMVDKLSTAPTKSNGYTVDGWKAPTLSERTTQVLRLAAFMIGDQPTVGAA
jgi:hypothetical protein